MSAFAGIVASPTMPHSETRLRSALDLLSDYAHGPQRVSRGATSLLGIVGYSGDLVCRNGWHIAGDFRLDNLPDLQRALRTSSERPAELLLLAWERWGPDCLREFAGDWAFALTDPRSDSLWLARDPTGQRPLFYRNGGADTCFASMPSAVAVLTGERLTANLDFLARALAQNPKLDGSCQFDTMKTVLPGEIVRFRRTTAERSFHWRPSIKPVSGLSDEDYVRTYRSLLTSAVQSRLPSDGSPAAVQLSSGWDSSAVAATLAQFGSCRDQVIAFTSAPADGFQGAVPRGRMADEAPLAALTAKRHSLRHIIIRNSRPVFEVVRSEIAAGQMPVFSPHNLAWWNEIRRSAREIGARTLFTAELGNLSLNAGGLSALTMHVAQRNWATLIRECRAAALREDVRWRGVLFNAFAPLLPRFTYNQLCRTFLGVPSSADCSFVQRELRFPVEDTRPSADPSFDRLLAIRMSDPGCSRMAALAQDGVAELDVMSDRRLIEFSLALPTEQLIRQGESRPMARAALAGRVPREVLDSPLRGFQTADWYDRFTRRNAQETFEEISSVAQVSELLDLKALAAAIDQWPTGEWNSPPVASRYRVGVANALAAGLFIAMTEAGQLGGKRQNLRQNVSRIPVEVD